MLQIVQNMMVSQGSELELSMIRGIEYLLKKPVPKPRDADLT